MEPTTVIRLNEVDVIRGGRTILSHINWQVRQTERWIIVGPNGSGKTTLCKLASLYIHPSHGTIEVLGKRLGRVDVRELRKHIGFTSAAVAAMLRPKLVVEDVVIAGKNAALAPYWHTYTDEDHAKAEKLLRRFGCSDLAHAEFGTLSSGERQRVLLARTLMSDPSLLLLDEPTAGLDLGGREDLVVLLAGLAADETSPAIVMVTHHVDEIPPGFEHVLLLKDGHSLIAGAIERTLTSDWLRECFGLPLSVERRNGRWSAWGASQGR